ncbi:MAG TPA: hypothetical protein VMN60_00365 [Longimicrobiales bacterium]|nr:hypothetical protein [Longimicrobiales bacterium]
MVITGLHTLASAAPLHGQDRGVGATECCLPLLFPIGARAVGTGNSLTARDGPDALHVNPAALAGLAKDEFRVHNAKTEFETSNTFALALRIRTAGVVGIAYRLIDYGEAEATDDFGNPTGILRLLEQSLLATFATTMADGLTAGISYKLFQFRQDCNNICGGADFSATTHGIDAGVQFHPRIWPALQLGAAVTHVGLPLQVINAEQASPMPSRIRAGAAYELMHHFSADTTTVVWATADVATSWRTGVPPVAAVGVEVILDRTMYVRTGYTTGTGRTAGAAVGLGLRYDRFDVGVAKSFVASATGTPDPFQVTFAITF